MLVLDIQIKGPDLFDYLHLKMEKTKNKIKSVFQRTCYLIFIKFSNFFCIIVNIKYNIMNTIKATFG